METVGDYSLDKLPALWDNHYGEKVEMDRIVRSPAGYMGLQIGIARSSDFGPSRNVTGTPSSPQRTQADPASVGFRGPSSKDRNSTNPFKKEQPEPERVGFGRGSVSVPTAAVKTIDKNLEAAAEIVPTLEETRQQIRERLDKVQQELDQATAKPQTRQFDFTVGATQAASQTRTFIRDVSQAAGAARATVQGEPPPASGPRIDIRIGDQTLPLLRQTSGPAFDFFA